MLGLLLRFQHAPKNIQTMLNRLFVATSRDASSDHLRALGVKAMEKAVDMMRQTERVTVLLFDNVDIYLRVHQNRVTSATNLVNLTSRTLLQLPESFKSSAVTESKLAVLQRERDLKMDELVSDGAFLKESAMLFLGRELLRAVEQRGKEGLKRTNDTLRLLREFVEDCRKTHARDEIEAAPWLIAPMTLIEENEGSLEGTLAVLEDSAISLGVLEENEADDTSNIKMDIDDALSDIPAVRTFSRTATLPAGAKMIVAGDLKTHRNVQAGLKARSEQERVDDRLDFYHSVPAPWHLLLNWVWTIFKTYFSIEKVGYVCSLERLRDALRRGKSALKEDEPSFNEAWALIKHIFAGWTRSLFGSELSKTRKSIATWTPKDVVEIRTLVESVWAKAVTQTAIRAAQERKDEIGANARCFMRDAILALEWDDACRRGDVGRMRAAQGVLAVCFAGAGRHQYSQSCLDEVWAHKVLEHETWRTLAAARVLNRFGARNGFEGVDLYQEHLNRELQRVDTTHGADNAVERLRDTFSSISEAGRALRKSHQDLLGDSGRTWRHDDSSAKDIQKIQILAEQDGLFDLRCDRVRQGKKASPATPTPDESEDDAEEKGQKVQDLIQELLLPIRINDVLDEGLVYLQRWGLDRWAKLRDPEEQYDAFLQNMEGDALSQDAELVMEDDEGARVVLTDEQRDMLERTQREKDWVRRNIDSVSDVDQSLPSYGFDDAEQIQCI
ncbi:hypothetical protein CF319_g7060 [Tilletia indica]|nr:hypothetical protein CF319_g7060 [Tilletia indica]